MKTKYYLIAIIFCLSLGSCKKYLETEPTDFLNSKTYYETEAQLEFARASVYNNLGTSQLYGAWANYLFFWQGDEGYMNRVTLTTGPFNNTYSAGDVYTAGLWSNLFNGINRANVLLANVDKNATISQAKRDKIKGEVLFLRGYYYFMLAQNFGGVPLKLTPTNSVIDVDIPRASLKETYDQILKDMEAAEPLIQNIATIGYGGVVSKSAVRGILARVNLYMAGEPLKDKTKYAAASKWAKLVMDDAASGHDLNPSYPQIFMNLAGDKYDIKESIWEVEFFGNRTDQFVETGNIGWINGPSAAAALNTTTGRADAYMNISSKFYNLYEPGDNRKWFNIAHFTYIAGVNGAKSMIGTIPINKNSLFPAKFRREYETLIPKSPISTPQNQPVLRFSDILLMYAEAENEINGGPTAAAIEAVNRVRRRAWSSGINTINLTNGGSGYTSAPTVTFSGGGGSGATATATITAGSVTAITLNRDLAGIMFFEEGKYSSIPTVTITGGGGSGAAASATVYKITDANLESAKTASKAAFLAHIQNERMLELNFELLRKADLLRWGIFLPVFQDMGNQLQLEIPGSAVINYFKNASSRDLLMPIPSGEMNTNVAMVQNPGWN